MATKVWLDLTMYGIRLFVNLDQVNKTNHMLVVAGPRIDAHRRLLAELGFARDARFKTEYWVRPLQGVTPKQIHAVFPRSYMREMPLEVVMPALAATGKRTNQNADQSENTHGPQLSDARHLPGDADRSQSVAGAAEPAVLGANHTRNPDDGKPGDAEQAGSQDRKSVV